MEGLQNKKTEYLVRLENIENKIKSLTNNMSAGGMRFFLLHLLYELHRTIEFFANVEKQVDEKVYTSDILEIDADVDYEEWSKAERWQLNIEAQNLPEDSELKPIEKTIWGMLDALPPNDSDNYVAFSRTDYKLSLQEILWSKCSNKQLYYALVQSIQNLRKTLINIGNKQDRRGLTLPDGEKLYKGEELRFNLSEASVVIDDFNQWKSKHYDDEEAIKRYIDGKLLSELSNLFNTGFLSSILTQQNEVDFTTYKDEFNFERLHRICENLDVEAHYSALRELFTYNKGVLIPNKGKIGKYFFKYRKKVDDQQRIALFRFVKLIGLIEDVKNPKVEVIEALNYEGIKIAMKNTYFPKCSDALNSKYNTEWLDNYMIALMDSKHRDVIATQWANSVIRRQVYCAILGALKDKGVLKGSYAALARMLYDGNVEDEQDKEKKNQMKRDIKTLARYISKGKEHVIGEWTKEYLKQ